MRSGSCPRAGARPAVLSWQAAEIRSRCAFSCGVARVTISAGALEYIKSLRGQIPGSHWSEERGADRRMHVSLRTKLACVAQGIEGCARNTRLSRMMPAPDGIMFRQGATASGRLRWRRDQLPGSISSSEVWISNHSSSSVPMRLSSSPCSAITCWRSVRRASE